MGIIRGKIVRDVEIVPMQAQHGESSFREDGKGGWIDAEGKQAKVSSMDEFLKQEDSELQKKIEVLRTVAASVDNDGSSYPVWFIVDPKQNMRCDPSWAAEQLVGPFFSRKAAADHLASRRYAYSPKAIVYCKSAYWSQDYRKLYEASLQLRKGNEVPKPSKVKILLAALEEIAKETDTVPSGATGVIYNLGPTEAADLAQRALTQYREIEDGTSD
jgi:hypothetical protein